VEGQGQKRAERRYPAPHGARAHHKTS